MKRTALLTALAGLAILTGCDGAPTPNLLSLEPVAGDAELAPVPGFAGAWDDGDGTIVVRRGKDDANAFAISYISGDVHLLFNAKPFRAGGCLFLDLLASDSDDFHVSGHAIARIWVTGNEFRWAFVDSDWFKQQTGGTLPNHQIDGKTVLTAPGSSVLEALANYGASEQAYGKTATATRIQ